ncbi:MAG TPA: hypothetical protein VGB37_00550, partial [Candidatus Lokiarchaeia archaeon]
MVFDKNYYQNKRDELTKKYAFLKDGVINDITNILNRFYSNQKDLQERFTELDEREAESKKKTD